MASSFPRELFVYGTLMSPFRNPAARALHRCSRLLGRAVVAGRLYRIHRYPGALPARSRADLIHGEVYRAPREAAFWRRMDRYEGSEYHRALTAAQLLSGRRCNVWIYWLRRAGRARKRIASGDFCMERHPVWFAPRWGERRI